MVHELAPQRGVLIGGTRQEGGRGVFSVLDPADETLLSLVSDGDDRQARAAVDAAAEAADGWARAAPRVRSQVLYAVHQAVLDDRERLAGLIVAENGKARSDADAEVRYAAEFFRWYAEEAVRSGGDFASAPAGGSRTVLTHRPVGVAALVTPWNFPAAMVTRKVAPALAAGCTVVLKPAAETPLTAIALAQLAAAQGVPEGVLNVVPTTDPGEVVGAWLEDDRVRKLSFTGSTPVGRTLLRQCAARVINASMELGGNAPFVVMDDANIPAAVDGAMVAKFRGGGQACTAANRFYVHDAVADEFVARLGERVRSLRVGPGSDPGSQIGPLINQRAVERIESLVDDALQSGACMAARGTVPDHFRGYFFPPTLLDRVTPECRLVSEEIFGPVAPIVRWSRTEEMLAMVNGSELGLAAYVYSRDLRAAMRLGERMEAGMVGVNRAMVSDAAAPFGGVKQSGLGREGARQGLEAYQEPLYLSVDWPDQ